jgi:hypothetical protein
MKCSRVIRSDLQCSPQLFAEFDHYVFGFGGLRASVCLPYGQYYRQHTFVNPSTLTNLESISRSRGVLFEIVEGLIVYNNLSC